MKKLTAIVVSALFAAVAFTCSAVTYYASPNGADDADCTEADPGSGPAAMLKASAGAHTVIFADGDYDFSAVTNYTENGRYSCYKPAGALVLKSASGNPEKCRLIGGGSASGTRFVYMTGVNVSAYGLQFTNFYSTAVGTGSNVGYYQGGGVFRQPRNASGDLTVSNCIFRANGSSYAGGCVRLDYGGTKTFTFMDCLFEDNAAGGAGGAIARDDGGSVKVYRCTFNRNQGTAGGAIRCADGLTLEDSSFTANHATGTAWNSSGGALVSKATIYRCAFTNNTTATGGDATAIFSGATKANNSCGAVDCTFVCAGGIPFFGCKLTRCTVENLDTRLQSQYGLGDLENCLFVNCHRIGQKGSAMLITAGNAVNCTFANCSAEYGVNADNAGFFSKNTKLTNCLFADCTGFNPYMTQYLTNCVTTSTAKQMASVVDGANNQFGVSLDQIRFVGSGSHPYSIQRKSVACNAGTNSVGYTESSLDLAGNPRLFGKSVDAGCYENQEPAPGLMLLLR